MSTQLDIVRAYHERSKHRLTGYARGPEYLDWENQPDPFRVYQGCELTQLALLESAQPCDPAQLSITSVANLLQLSLGLSAWKQYGANRWALRCNPSSGNLHPTEGYVIACGIDGIEEGVHHYAPHDHVLEHRGILSDPKNSAPTLFIGLSSIVWREAWKYGERAFRYVQLDVGHAIAAIKYAASSLKLHASLVSIDDDSLAKLLGIDRAQDYSNAEREHPDVLLKITTAGNPQTIELPQPDQWKGRANCLGGEPHHEWKVLQEITQATWNKNTHSQNRHDECFNKDTFNSCIDESDKTLITLIQQRRSGQAFSARNSEIMASDFYSLLNALIVTEDTNSPAYWELPVLLHPVIFVHRINGLQPGLYALPRHPQAYELMQQLMDKNFIWQKPPNCPAHLPLYQLADDDTRRQARSISCHQEIASSSAFSLGLLSEFDRGLQAGAAAYRQLYWEAGFLGHHLYLQAEAMGKRGTGIGCFFDDEFHQLLGLSNTVFQDLYHFTVGQAVEDERLQTLPPYAHLKNRDSTFSRIAQQQMQSIKQRISEIVTQREKTKTQIETGELKPGAGLSQLAVLDAELSELDTRYKTLWDQFN